MLKLQFVGKWTAVALIRSHSLLCFGATIVVLTLPRSAFHEYFNKWYSFVLFRYLIVWRWYSALCLHNSQRAPMLYAISLFILTKIKLIALLFCVVRCHFYRAIGMCLDILVSLVGAILCWDIVDYFDFFFWLLLLLLFHFTHFSPKTNGITRPLLYFNIIFSILLFFALSANGVLCNLI